ncbi:hypothetical protein AK830_g12461 [Neonectria ditissima]|uniref:Amidoligase enzyme n=1 Tax=Neonectria ditissima TaxID=78410 RepID=A0A0P7B0F4_9HYPO|nr:hypothetical protein AK830_g12461 [Neonectria ditissima]
MASPNPQDLTFGIELEFMSEAPKPSPPRGAYKAARLNIAKLLARHTDFPIAIECLHNVPEDCIICSRVRRRRDGCTHLFHAGAADVDPDGHLEGVCFVVKDEPLGEHMSKLNLERNWPGLEIASPIFTAGDLAAGLPDMARVVAALRDMDARVTADEACGLHVHVGVAGGMQLLLAKKMLTLVAIFEQTLFFQLVGPSRVVNACAAPVEKDILLARARAADNTLVFDPAESTELLGCHVPPVKTMRPAEWNKHDPTGFYAMLRAVWESRSLQRLCALTRGTSAYRGGCYVSLRTASGQTTGPQHEKGSLEKTPTTIEFRYAQMSFDMEFVTNWTTVLSQVVKIAQLDAADFQKRLASIYELLNQTAERGEHPWQEMMRQVLGLEDQLPAWKRLRERYCLGEEIPLLDKEKLLMPVSR